jgi:hypothetical protein
MAKTKARKIRKIWELHSRANEHWNCFGIYEEKERTRPKSKKARMTSQLLQNPPEVEAAIQLLRAKYGPMPKDLKIGLHPVFPAEAVGHP